MNKRLQGFAAGALAVAMLSGMPTLAKETAETITAVYHNVKLVVDGVLIEPKDANGNVVEPFIYNGTTYLPVRAVAEAFEKDVTWDQGNYTVFLGGEVEKPAKELPLWNRPYTECSAPNNVRFREEKGDTYICGETNRGIEVGDKRFMYSTSITYPLNTLAKTIKGEFYISNDHSPEGVLKIYGTNGKVLYKSPIMRGTTTPVKFEVNIENELEIEIVVEITHGNSYGGGTDFYIKNPVIVSSDY
ncbi:MAG: stalk domain-containing protein [Clostridia bacterium]